MLYPCHKYRTIWPRNLLLQWTTFMGIMYWEHLIHVCYYPNPFLCIHAVVYTSYIFLLSINSSRELITKFFNRRKQWKLCLFSTTSKIKCPSNLYCNQCLFYHSLVVNTPELKFYFVLKILACLIKIDLTAVPI